MHNGYGNGKRWLLVGLLILGGFWLVNDSYQDGFSDGLISSGQGTVVRGYRGGPHVPWGLLIVGGIAYVAWRKGAFDRFGGPGGPFNGGGRGMQRYGDYRPGNGPAQTPGTPGPGQHFGPAFRGPRAFFDEWHREAHEAEQRQKQSSGYYQDYPRAPVPPAPSHPEGARPSSPTAAAGNGAAHGEAAPTPPPPPPAPDYWAAMARAAGTTEATNGGGAPVPPPPVPTSAQADERRGRPVGARRYRARARAVVRCPQRSTACAAWAPSPAAPLPR